MDRTFVINSIKRYRQNCTDYNLAYPFRELGWDLDEDISPQIYSRQEWKNNSFTPFYKNVEHDKVVLL